MGVRKMQGELEQVRDWAKDKLQEGSEPPWAWYQYMKLVETTDAILAGMKATSPTGSLLKSDQHPETHLRLVDSTHSPNNAQPRFDTVPVQLPT